MTPEAVVAALAGPDGPGFCVVPAVLDLCDLQLLREAFSDAAAGSTEHVDIDEATPHGDRWRALPQREPLRTVVTLLLGADAVFRVHGRNPRPGGGAQGLHADRPATSAGRGIEALTSIWFLDDTSAVNGSTRVVPGTQRRRQAVPRDLSAPDRRHPHELVVPARAGDVLVFDAHLWHGGTRNRSASGRRSAQLTATAARAVLPTFDAGG